LAHGPRAPGCGARVSHAESLPRWLLITVRIGTTAPRAASSDATALPRTSTCRRSWA